MSPNITSMSHRVCRIRVYSSDFPGMFCEGEADLHEKINRTRNQFRIHYVRETTVKNGETKESVKAYCSTCCPMCLIPPPRNSTREYLKELASLTEEDRNNRLLGNWDDAPDPKQENQLKESKKGTQSES